MLETKIDSQKTALLVVDMQNDLVKVKDGALAELYNMVRANRVISNTKKTVKAARKAGLPIVFIKHVLRDDYKDVVPSVTDVMLRGEAPPPRKAMIEGTPGAEIIDELKPAPGDYVIAKRRGDAFYNTELELILRSRGVDTLILGGVVTNGCILATFMGARERDFHTIVVSDCCAGTSQELHDWPMKNLFPRSGRVRTADEIVAELTRPKKK